MLDPGDADGRRLREVPGQDGHRPGGDNQPLQDVGGHFGSRLLEFKAEEQAKLEILRNS